jgi:hypothetical protein
MSRVRHDSQLLQCLLLEAGLGRRALATRRRNPCRRGSDSAGPENLPPHRLELDSGEEARRGLGDLPMPASMLTTGAHSEICAM